jgi:hypothetical protein
MEIKDLYGLVLMLVLIGILMGISFLILDKFQTSSGITNNAATFISNTSASIMPISTTWLPIIVVISAAAIVLSLVINAFRQ